MIRVDNLRKQFGPVVAVDDVSFTADDGKVTGLLGPNGAGKTTTLRMIYALMRPDAGAIAIDEVDAVAQPQKAQARMGVLPDVSGLYPRLTPREHLEYYGQLQGLSGRPLTDRIEQLLKTLDMGKIADRRAEGFSHGERTKVALARALVHDPPNVLLYEPTNGLDVMSTRAVRTIIRRLRADGRCVVFSSHVMQEVSALCDAIIVIARGRIVAAGSPDELREQTGHKSLEDAFVTLAGPLITGFMLTSVAGRQRLAEEIEIPVVGMEHAPALVAWLRQQSGITVVPLGTGQERAENGESAGTAAPKDAEAAVRDRDQEVVVVIMDSYRDKFRVSSPARVKIVSDGSRQASRPQVQRVRTLLQRYSAEIGALRLVGRGVSPAIAAPLQIEDVEVSSAQQRAATILSFIPIFIVLAAFTGGMQIATDSTAGERERGSLEPLLVNPAPRHVFAAGKWLAATLAAMLSVIITTSLVLLMLRYIPLQELGIRFRIGPAQIAGLLGALLPLCLMSTSLQAYLATFARSFKEAQSYMGLLIMLPMIPGMVTTVYPITSQPWMYPIPLVGQHVLATDILGGKPTPVWAFVAAGAAAVVVALGLVRLTTGLLQRERIIFSR